MIDSLTLVTIVLMASSTYLTRITGYLVLRNRTLNPKMLEVLENVPGCVLISVIAPAFVSDKVSDLIALALTLFLATRFSILPTVVIGVIATALLRHFVAFSLI
ncbi:AzlD family protein [Vibrio tritonius]|uniref:AzlD family protein n=1 Tax=Vibrio tritonius TaxID=1435069 RepID=A0ABS7YKZ9_9VIBR|nr:AzlD family protein [Vibrio tritonius]MCA2016345.1 AzlD family protein [Vibrio tritonius]